MTDHPVSGRFDVHATGELSGSFDSAEERARLLHALNADRDLCSALLCGEQQLLCRGVEWAQAQAFAALMRDCGVVTQVVPHGDATVEPLAAVAPERGLALEAMPEPPPDEESVGSTWATRRPVIYEAEVVVEPPVKPSAAALAGERVSDVVADGGGDIPRFLLEADARERGERRRQQRRWGLASLLVLVVALIVAFAGGEESFSSQQAYVHVLAGAVHAGADGVVAELLVKPGQQLQRGEAVAVIAPDRSAAQRRIEVTPEAGTVDQIGVRVGQRVQSDDPLLTLARPGSAYLLVYFTPEQLRELPGRSVVQINLDDFPGQPVLGRLADRTDVASASAGSAARSPVRIDFEDQLPLLQRLRSGMAASVTVRRQQGVD